MGSVKTLPLTVLACASLCLSAIADSKLNAMFITLDDMNRDSVGVYGSKVKGTTPNIDKLAGEGLRFEHGHVSIAICMPTRAVWMTGRYPHNSGALGFTKINPGVPTLPETLLKNGFMTGILGKTEHVVPSPKSIRVPSGPFRDGQRAKPGIVWPIHRRISRTGQESGQTFFLMVNAHDPHRPFDNRKPASERKFADHAEEASKNKKKGKRGDYPAPSRIFQPDEVVIPGFLPDLPPIREEIAQYYSSVSRADGVVGRVLVELEKAGFAKNTLVMLKSDHGIPVPFAKTNVWRHSTLTPWIVRWPGTVKPGTHETEHAVAGVDLAPTILEALGLPPMKGMDGRSFLPVLRGKKQKGREFVYTHINTIASGRSYAMRSLQGKRYGLIWNGWHDGETTFKNESMSGLTWKAMAKAAQNDPALAKRVKHYLYRVPFEFYDYGTDPDALNNLIDDEEHAEWVDRYGAELLKVMKKTKDHETGRFQKALSQIQ